MNEQMGEQIKNSGENSPEKEWAESMVRVDLVGNPEEKVVENARESIALTLNEMRYRGEAPPVVISEGDIFLENGEVSIACYDWKADPPTIKISQAGLKDLWAPGIDIPDEISVLVAASEETVHFVQDKQGRLPPPDQRKRSRESMSDSGRHYQDPIEKEAEDISFRVTNRILGHEFIKPREKIHDKKDALL